MHNLSASENSGGDDFLDISCHLAKVDKRIVFTETRSNNSSRKSSSSSSSNVVVSASINIKNTSGDSERIIYKVKNTSTDSFKVFPIIGTLEKGQSEKIKITVKPNFPKSLISYEHFQVQVMPIPRDYVPNLKGDGYSKNASKNEKLQNPSDKSNTFTPGSEAGTETLHVNANNLETPCQNDTSPLTTTSVETLKLIWLNILHKQVAIEKHYINCHYLNASIALDHSKNKQSKNPADFEGTEPNKYKLTPELQASNNTQNIDGNNNKHKRKLSLTSEHRKHPESPRKNHDTSFYSKNIDADGIRNRHFAQGAQKPSKGGGGAGRRPDDPRLNNNNNYSTKIRPLNQDENGNDIIDFDKDFFSFSGNFLGASSVEPNPNDWNADDEDDDRKELFFHSMETYGWHRFAFVMAIVVFMLFLLAIGVIQEHIPPPPPPPTFTVQQDNSPTEEEDTFALGEGTTLEIIRSYAFRWLHDPRLTFKLF